MKNVKLSWYRAQPKRQRDSVDVILQWGYAFVVFNLVFWLIAANIGGA